MQIGGITFYKEYLIELSRLVCDKRKEHALRTCVRTCESDPIDKSQGRRIAPLRWINPNSACEIILLDALRFNRRFVDDEKLIIACDDIYCITRVKTEGKYFSWYIH